ncbi:D-beta-hydroxybutyrate dehydrogenase [Geodia barretti]|uniref:3-oxoacyl-[acyl-carrier-protein] reductase n=1 Tax=Geodia barretti TaxID=519541 RepID=A0AA35R7A6_GEOBA|nr:D-beta-hydroxybutyrate dehydrogenase [Geodia barretti]
MVNIAGVTGPIETPVQDIDVADFDYVITANEIGTFLPIKYVVPTMIAQRSGKIVNIGGTSGLRGYAMRTAYSASKWAVRGITRTVALEVGKYNVNVNAVCPGIVETPRMQKLCEEKARVRGWTIDQVYDEYVQEMCLKRVTTPDDVANAVLFMASEDSRQITGQAITVDGGWDV